MIIKASGFIHRQDLEKFIVSELGNDEERNRLDNHVIQGKEEELKRLGLDDSCRVYGVKVISLDKPTREELQNKNPNKKLTE